MTRIYPEICANCDKWCYFDNFYCRVDELEDESGLCKVHGEEMYCDEVNCGEHFNMMKHPRVYMDAGVYNG